MQTEATVDQWAESFSYTLEAKYTTSAGTFQPSHLARPKPSLQAWPTPAKQPYTYDPYYLADIGFTQEFPTEIQADNRGAMQVATVQQPTRRTRHIDMKQFVILQWSEEDLISFTE